jgi:hypothetical protein
MLTLVCLLASLQENIGIAIDDLQFGAGGEEQHHYMFSRQ